jgi:putative acetyltransferase
MNDLLIRAETPEDREAVFRVHATAFPTDAEARLVDALRDGGHGRVSLVAEREGKVIGHVLFSTLEIVNDEGNLEVLSLAPLAVLPEHQRRGVGSRLVREGLKACREAGHRAVFVVGEPEYYGAFGFTSSLAGQFDSPYPGEAFMAIELTPGGLRGVVGSVRYPPPFHEFE